MDFHRKMAHFTLMIRLLLMVSSHLFILVIVFMFFIIFVLITQYRKTGFFFKLVEYKLKINTGKVVSDLWFWGANIDLFSSRLSGLSTR